MEVLPMKDLLDEGLEALAGLLQSGALSCHPETEERLARLGRDFEDNGLHTGAQLLTEVSQALSSRRHGGETSSMELMDRVGPAVRYIRLCQQKYALDAAGEQLRQGIGEADDEEGPPQAP